MCYEQLFRRENTSIILFLYNYLKTPKIEINNLEW